MSRRRHSASKLAAAIVAGFGVVCTVQAEDLSDGRIFESIQQKVSHVLEKCRSAVVKIEAEDEHGRLSGTGFFVDPNGTLYTTYSVGGETRDITVIRDDVRYPATRLIGDLRSGIAILKIEAETPFLSFGHSKDLKVTSPIITVGYPMSLPVSASFGMVGGFDLKYQGRYFATTHIRANVPVQRGQGGAPLLNLNGDVVGILISSLDQGSASFALPIEAAEKVRRDFLRFHEVRRGWLGLQVGSVPEPVNGSNAEIKEVFPDSPALKAGLQQGDILLSVDNHRIANPEDVLDTSFYLTAEDEVKVKLIRGGQELELPLTPTERPNELPGLKRLAPSGIPNDLPMPTPEK